MSDGDRRRDRDDGLQSEQALRALLQRGGPRPVPPPADEAESRAAVFAEWNAVTGRRAHAWRAAAAVAATAVVASLVMFSGERPSSAAVVAHAERVRGAVSVAGGGDESGALESGEALVAGATLVTNDGEAALRLAAGGSLRLAPETRLVFTADGAVELIAGKLYFDSEDARGGAVPAFVVVTAAGALRDVGTQFMVSAERGSVELGVRDGRVAWRTDAREPAVEAVTGERLVVAGDGRIERGTVATFGSYWEWAERLAPPFSLDGRTLSEVVEWTATQTGRRVVYADTAEAEADTVVHITGSADLGPLDQLALAMAVTGFEYRIEGDSIVVALP